MINQQTSSQSFGASSPVAKPDEVRVEITIVRDCFLAAAPFPRRRQVPNQAAYVWNLGSQRRQDQSSGASDING
jgi:hypothetical protein